MIYILYFQTNTIYHIKLVSPMNIYNSICFISFSNPSCFITDGVTGSYVFLLQLTIKKLPHTKSETDDRRWTGYICKIHSHKLSVTHKHWTCLFHSSSWKVPLSLLQRFFLSILISYHFKTNFMEMKSWTQTKVLVAGNAILPFYFCTSPNSI